MEDRLANEFGPRLCVRGAARDGAAKESFEARNEVWE
jgi:hypothetical protein